MKSVFWLAAVTWFIVNVSILTAETEKVVYKAATTEEFMKAIGPDRIIDLTNNEYKLDGVTEFESEYCRWVEENPGYSGSRLLVRNVDNMEINTSSIIWTWLITPFSFVPVMDFVNCSGIKISGLNMMHKTYGRYCTSEVIHLENCSNFLLLDVMLEGCGYIGIEAENCSSLVFEHSGITHCSAGIMELIDCKDFSFTNSWFSRNDIVYEEDWGGVSLRDTKSVLFEDCGFSDNKFISAKSRLFYLDGDSSGLVKNTRIKGTEETFTLATKEEEHSRALAYLKTVDYKQYDWELIKNAYLGNTEIVRILLERDANPNVRLTDNGCNVLQVALYADNGEIAGLLLDAGADCLNRDTFRRNALFYAARNHNMEILERVAKGTDLLYSDIAWRPPTVYAAVYDNYDMLEYLFDDFYRYEDHNQDHNGRGISEYAAANAREDFLDRAQGNNLRFCHPDRILVYSIAAGDKDLVRKTLWNGKVTPDASHLVLAIMGDNSFYKYEIAEMQLELYDPGYYFNENYEGEERTFKNTPENYNDIFQTLLTKVKDLNARNSEDITPLIACAMANDKVKANILLDKGVNPFLRYQGMTALDILTESWGEDADPSLVEMLRNAMK
jgi:ankyrin repeat protein